MKQLKVSSFDFGFTREAAWEEAYVPDRCRGHPHIVQLLDIYMKPLDDHVIYPVMEL